MFGPTPGEQYLAYIGLDDREIHESHDPEPDGQRLYPGGQACRRCGRFVAFDQPRYRVTDSGVQTCRPVKVELRTT